MGQELAVLSDRKSDGIALAVLSNRHRDFVLRLIELCPSKKAAAKAAADVGYHSQHGYVLMRDERVLAAIREEAGKKLVGAMLIGVQVLIEIAKDKKHKDNYKAAKLLVGLNGFSPEQRIVVEHATHDTKKQIEEVRAMAKELGLDPDQLLGTVGSIEDATFTEVPENDTTNDGAV